MKQIIYSDDQGTIILDVKRDENMIYVYKKDEQDIDWIVIQFEIISEVEVILHGITIHGREHIIDEFNKPNRLDRVMSITHHIFLELNIETVYLDDDAETYIGENLIHLRTYRAMIGKRSIYEKYGYYKIILKSEIREEEFSMMNVSYIMEKLDYNSHEQLIIKMKTYLEFNKDHSIKAFTEYLTENKSYNILSDLIDVIQEVAIKDKLLRPLLITNEYCCDDITVYKKSTIEFIY